jgi:transposase
MPRAGPRKVQRYSLEFKLKAVKLSQLTGVEVQAVADALESHPFMLSKWRKEARDGVLRGRVSEPKAAKTPPARDIKRWQSLQRAHTWLQEEHALLKKLIRFTSARKPTSSRSSKKIGAPAVSGERSPSEHDAWGRAWRERHMESFFHSLKADVIHGRSFQTVDDLRQQLRHYVRYYNYQRLHSSLGDRSPVDYERRAA